MLRGHFLGGFRITVGEVTIDGPRTRNARAILAYLMLNPGRTFGRQALAETIWGDGRAGDVMKALSQELWHARTAFDEKEIDREPLISLSGEELGVTGTPWVDAAAFEAAIEPHIASSDNALDDASAAALQETVDLYTGPLLPSLYDDWCVFPREILSDKYIIALERLMAWHADPDRQNWGAALLCGRRLLAVDALLEHVHRDMMRGHYQRGDRPAALRQFIQCKEQLRRELMIEPMAETIALYEAIRAENDAEILRRAVARHGSRGRVHSRHSGATAISTFGAAPHTEVPGVQPTRRETGGK